MLTTPRHPPISRSRDWSSAHAQSEQADDARRALRRRHEVRLCVLVSVLGILVARAIPLAAHEDAVCTCRAALTSHALSTTVRARGLVPVGRHMGGTPLGPGPFDLALTTEGTWLLSAHARVLVADHCDQVRP